MSDRILFVDDEPAVLAGFTRMLHREFTVHTAVGGEEGLAEIDRHGPYAVVVSDMRMPGMDGVQFLTRVRTVAPDTVRMVLTGHADVDSAMNAVNEGHIFRFLSKPCDKETLAKALTTALVQFRLVNAEKELLENTLMGSIKVLTDVLSLVNPAAFGRSVRIKRYVCHIVKKLQLKGGWRFEAAAMLSQLGCMTLDNETIEAVYTGKRLSPDEQARYDLHPRVACDLLSNIPRLEPIAWMIGEQQNHTGKPGSSPGANGQNRAAPPVPPSNQEMHQLVSLGAQILRIAICFDDLRVSGTDEGQIIERLRTLGDFDPRLTNALAELQPDAAKMEVLAVDIADLMPGMILQEEVRTDSGVLIVAKGQEVTHPLMVRLRNFRDRKVIPSKLMTMVPIS